MARLGRSYPAKPLLRQAGGAQASGASAVVTGTITASVTEADIVAGGKTVIITLTGDTWIAAGAGSFDLQRDEIMQGLDSAQSEALGWNLQVRDLEPVTSVVRTSDTIVTITLGGSPLYNITAQETITVTVPGTALAGGVDILATPTFTVDLAAAAGRIWKMAGWGGGLVGPSRGLAACHA
jgi:hypothetical protein